MSDDNDIPQESGENWTLWNGDCCEVIKGMPDSSVDLTVFSPPFSSLYVYSDSIADMGNSDSDGEFFEHFGFLASELFRVTVPGRLVAMHVKDLPKYFGRDGAAGLKDFPGDVIRCMEGVGFTFHSRCTIWKCPVIEQERTKNNGLLHKTLCRDSSQVRQGMADYMIVMRKVPRETLVSDKPIVRPHSRETCFTEYIGSKDQVVMSANCSAGEPERGANYGLEIWQIYASPVWFDIQSTDVLNYRIARTDEDTRHICPLQLGVIGRCVELWSAPGDVVFDPFSGIGSTGYVAVGMGRKSIGCELKRSYFDTACDHMRIAEARAKEDSRSLFDLISDQEPG